MDRNRLDQVIHHIDMDKWGKIPWTRWWSNTDQGGVDNFGSTKELNHSLDSNKTGENGSVGLSDRNNNDYNNTQSDTNLHGKKWWT